MTDDTDKPKLKLERGTWIESKLGDPPPSNWPASVHLGRSPVNIIRQRTPEERAEIERQREAERQEGTP